MSEEKKTSAEEEKHQESKRYLIFYVIALFSVALVLIFGFYPVASRAAQQPGGLRRLLAAMLALSA